MLPIRTDLALESIYTHKNDGINKQQRTESNCTVTEIAITTQEASDLVGKPMGKFITLEFQSFPDHEPDILQQNVNMIATELSGLLPEKSKKILVVGLGNRRITPDALGPSTLDRVMITNHVVGYLNTDGTEDFRAVCGICPGVLGITGMETVDIVKGVVQQYRPSLIIAVDALCAGSPERMFSTVQLTDTGIHPGSGVGNCRDGLNEATLGVPVIAIGIPTVVDSHSIVYSSISEFFRANESLEEAEGMISHMMKFAKEGLFVSPKDIDNLIFSSARTLAGGINLALHKNIDLAFSEHFVS